MGTGSLAPQVWLSPPATRSSKRPKEPSSFLHRTARPGSATVQQEWQPLPTGTLLLPISLASAPTETSATNLWFLEPQSEEEASGFQVRNRLSLELGLSLKFLGTLRSRMEGWATSWKVVSSGPNLDSSRDYVPWGRSLNHSVPLSLKDL